MNKTKNTYLTPAVGIVLFAPHGVIAVSLDGTTENYGTGCSGNVGNESYDEENGAW